MEEKIEKEITDFCEQCASKDCCPEEDCVLFRIEKIIYPESSEKEETENGTVQQ